MKTVVFHKQLVIAAIVGLLVAWFSAPAIGQVPSGTFSYVFTNTPVWDATGSYTNSSVIDGIGNDIIVDLTVAANGQISGNFNDTIDDGTLTVDVASSIAGKMSVKGEIVGASVKMEDGTVTGSFSGTAKGGDILSYDVSARTLTNDFTLTVCADLGKKTECKTYTGSTPFSLPGRESGDWTLDTSITNNVDKLGGTGTLTLSTGRSFTYQIVGTYTAKSGASKLKLVGESDAAGSSLSLTTSGTNMVLTTLKGKVLGQKPTLP